MVCGGRKTKNKVGAPPHVVAGVLGIWDSSVCDSGGDDGISWLGNRSDLGLQHQRLQFKLLGIRIKLLMLLSWRIERRVVRCCYYWGQLGDSVAINEPTEGQPWVDVIRGNQLSSHGKLMEFSAPLAVDGEIEVEIQTTNIKSELDCWDNLIMFALGEDLSMNAAKQFMTTVWNFVSLVKLYHHDEGYFIVRFKSAKDRDEAIMAKCPYTIYIMPMFLRQRTRDFVLKEDLLRDVPLWVTIPSLSLYLCGDSSLGKISSAVGKHLILC